jgi:uncharacterized membrane protein
MPFCTQCGHQVADADVFCASCGKPQAGPEPRSWPPPQPPPVPSTDPLAGLSPRTASILCYIPTVGWIAAVVVLSSRKFRGDRIVRFHAFQGLYLFAAWLVVQWVVHPIVMTMREHFIRIDHILEGLILAVSIFMMIKTSQDDPYVLPIIGELAQRSAAEQ